MARCVLVEGATPPLQQAERSSGRRCGTLGRVSEPAPHVSVATHVADVARLVGPGSIERIPLDRHALGRRLAYPLLAADDLPRFDNSAMDGYAVHPETPGQRDFVVVGDVPAGEVLDASLRPGEAARVMTGARVPSGTVAVVAVEQTDASPTGPPPPAVRLSLDARPGQHVRCRGEDVAAGSAVAAVGAEVSPALIALGRSAGCAHVEVHRPTGVAVVATGSELAAVGVEPGPGGIHESNSDMVAALAAAAGCDVVGVLTCGDDPDGLRALLDDLDARPDVDLVVTTGGVSAGAYEVVRQACGDLDSFSFRHLAMQPGGPQGLGRWGPTPVVCLPGTPVGAFVAFRMLLLPALDARHGRPARRSRTAVYTGATRRTRAGRVQFVTSVVTDDGRVHAPDARHLTALAAANCLVEVPEGVDQLIDGDVVTVHPL
jgi:molybdopterin molybdotransferase